MPRLPFSRSIFRLPPFSFLPLRTVGVQSHNFYLPATPKLKYPTLPHLTFAQMTLSCFYFLPGFPSSSSSLSCWPSLSPRLSVSLPLFPGAPCCLLGMVSCHLCRMTRSGRRDTSSPVPSSTHIPLPQTRDVRKVERTLNRHIFFSTSSSLQTNYIIRLKEIQFRSGIRNFVREIKRD